MARPRVAAVKTKSATVVSAVVRLALSSTRADSRTHGMLLDAPWRVTPVQMQEIPMVPAASCHDATSVSFFDSEHTHLGLVIDWKTSPARRRLLYQQPLGPLGNSVL